MVVPAYDVESYIATCLQSIARQSFADLEVIVVDDGSTDGAAHLAGRFAQADRRSRVIRREIGGLGRARNPRVSPLRSTPPARTEGPPQGGPSPFPGAARLQSEAAANLPHAHESHQGGHHPAPRIPTDGGFGSRRRVNRGQANVHGGTTCTPCKT